MGIAAPFACVFWRQVETSDGDSSAGCDVVEIDVLVSLFVGVGVVEDPFVAGQVCAVAVPGHNTFADNFDFVCAVLVKIEGIFV